MRFSFLVIIGFVLFFACPVFAATSAEGQQAYKDGDYRRAYEILKPFAVDGDSNAQLFLGVLFANGKGGEQNYKKAMYWYLKAMEQGHATAAFNLGTMFEYGRGVTQNYEQAFELYSVSAETGRSEERRVGKEC